MSDFIYKTDDFDRTCFHTEVSCMDFLLGISLVGTGGAEVYRVEEQRLGFIEPRYPPSSH